jgi:putative CocE/NonD family hydrolase
MAGSDATYDVSVKDERTSGDCRIDLHMVPMRDGTQLSTMVYRPYDEAPHHVVLTRTPYDYRDRLVAPKRAYLEQNVILVIQACRGNGLSEGEFHPFINEQADAEDTLSWLKKQPWFSGRLAMTGGSYSGLTQYLAAITAGPELVAFTATVSCSNVHDKLFMGGAFFLQLHMHWGMSMIYRSRFGNDNIPEWDDMGLAKHLPLETMDETASLGQLDFWRSWIEKIEDEAYWEPYAINHNYESITAPVYMTGGWYDFYTSGTLENFSGLRSRGGSEAARQFTRCIIGPWGHVGLMNPDVFGKENGTAKAETLLERFRFNMLEAPESDPLPGEPPLRYFMMGKDEWRSAQTWPPEDVSEQRFYLHAEDCANTSHGSGRLDVYKPGEEPADVYIYDPRNPVPSCGGCFIGPGENGCLDQREVETRSDVLVFVSTPLDDELEIAGPVKVTLYAASNSLDTDFVARLMDVYPDGRVLNLCDGIIRARYRNGKFKPELMEKDRIYKYEIDCWHTANCFRKGHRIGLDITSSNFPRFDRNPNTGDSFGKSSRLRPARQSIFHDTNHPSHVCLPVCNQSV